MSNQPRSQGLSSYRPGRARREGLSSLALGGKMRDPENEVDEQCEAGKKLHNKMIVGETAVVRIFISQWQPHFTTKLHSPSLFIY